MGKELANMSDMLGVPNELYRQGALMDSVVYRQGQEGEAWTGPWMCQFQVGKEEREKKLERKKASDVSKEAGMYLLVPEEWGAQLGKGRGLWRCLELDWRILGFKLRSWTTVSPVVNGKLWRNTVQENDLIQPRIKHIHRIIVLTVPWEMKCLRWQQPGR